MEINDIIRLMQAVKENELTSFRMEEGDLKLSIKKEKRKRIRDNIRKFCGSDRSGSRCFRPAGGSRGHSSREALGRGWK